MPLDARSVKIKGADVMTARTIAVRRGDTIKASAFTAMVQHIIATKRGGGWRRVKRARAATR